MNKTATTVAAGIVTALATSAAAAQLPLTGALWSDLMIMANWLWTGVLTAISRPGPVLEFWVLAGILWFILSLLISLIGRRGS